MGCCAVEWHEIALGVMSLLIPMLSHLTVNAFNHPDPGVSLAH